MKNLDHGVRNITFFLHKNEETLNGKLQFLCSVFSKFPVRIKSMIPNGIRRNPN